MIKSERIWVVLAVSVFLAACATGYSFTPYWQIKESAFAGLERGVTTKDDVLKQVGTPSFTSFFPNLDVEVWEFRYLEGTTRRMIAFVYFDPKGIFKHATHDLDPAFHNVDGGRN